MDNTWKDLELLFQHRLKHLYPSGEIKSLFLFVLEDLANIKPTEYVLYNAKKANMYEDSVLNILEELATGKPLQHILGRADFYGNKFAVNAHTLIPRPETEELVHLILQDYKNHKAPKIIDIGTGTGCIPITLHAKLHDAQTFAVDISDEALEIARKNNLDLEQNVHFISADILDWEFIFDKPQDFDVIVSNPPYITPNEKREMHPNVLNYEPHTALFVEEVAPLLFYDHITDFALFHLKNSGTLYFEINQYLSEETADLIRKKGFGKVEIFKDLNGADRIIRAKR